jgi:hypothetical protein
VTVERIGDLLSCELLVFNVAQSFFCLVLGGEGGTGIPRRAGCLDHVQSYSQKGDFTPLEGLTRSTRDARICRKIQVMDSASLRPLAFFGASTLGLQKPFPTSLVRQRVNHAPSL